MSKSDRSRSNWFGSLFVILFFAFALLMWLLMHRVISTNDSLIQGSEESKPESKHVQRLIDQTNILLKDIIKANITLSTQVLQEIKKLNIDKHLIQKDVNEIMRELQHTEDNFARCINEKYNVNNELNDCKQQAQSVQKISKEVSKPIVHSFESTVDAISAQGGVAVGRWLVIGIPTVARLHGEEYLLSSLEMIANQLPEDPNDLMYHSILVSVVNMQRNTANHDQPHTVFETARKLYAAPHQKAAYFEFIDIAAEEILPDPVQGSTAKNDLGNANKPGFLVRRQTRNIVSVMRRSVDKARYYLFLEDDMQLCANGFLAIQYLLSKASRYHPDWLAIRASYGMNGIFMHSKDLTVFADYLVKHQARRPPDHLVVEWYAGETAEAKQHRGNRANLGFKFNLFDHIGVVSTLRNQHSGSFPRCYELLIEPTVFQVEAFSPAQCPHDDLWPCKVARPDHFLIDWAKQHHHRNG